MNAQETDRKAIEDRFRAEIAQHTLDELNGKAPLNVRNALRSDTHVEAWRREILKLLANTPKGEFFTKLQAKDREAAALARVANRKAHFEKMARTNPIKAVGSGANLGQISAMVLAAHIRVGTQEPVKATLQQISELTQGLIALESESCPR